MTAPTSIELNPAGVAGVIAVAGGIMATVRQAFQAPQALHKDYGVQRSKVRPAIEADRILPALTALILSVSEQALGLDALTYLEGSSDEWHSTIERTLDSSDYLVSLRELSVLHADYVEIEAIFPVIVRWARRKGYAALAMVPGWAVVLGAVAVKGVTLQLPVLIVATLDILVFLVLLGVAWWLENASRNRLVFLFSKYE